jgi:DNA repair protein RadC
VFVPRVKRQKIIPFGTYIARRTTQKEEHIMKLEKMIEIVRIKQEIREVEEAYTSLLPKQIRSSPDAIAFIQALIAEEDREVFLVLCLNVKNEVIAIHKSHVGSLNASIVHPREVFKSAILNNAGSILVAHNHPSGNCQYSPEDIEVSKRLTEAGKFIGIEVLDSIIVSHSDGISLREKGLI